MSDYIFDDYNKFVGKHIAVIYEDDNKCKKLRCNLLKYDRKNSKERFIKLESDNNIIYNVNCDKIICWIVEYEDMFTENADAYKLDAKPMEANTSIKSEELSLKGSQDIETIPSEISNENTSYDELQENDFIPSDDKTNSEPSMVSIDNASITSEKHTINPIMIDMELNNDKMITDCKEAYGGDQVLDQYKKKDVYKKNDLSSSLATFINSNFQGAYLTIYTSSTQAISGEVIFNYDYLIVLKSDSKNYYINPEQITYFN
jgi:hypothetical protein